jgi:mono/diheme cytochrome c family protein
MRKLTLLVLAGLAVLALVACGGGGGASEVGDAARGEALYNQSTLGTKSAAGCVTCHKFDASQGDNVLAPYTSDIKGAGERVPGVSAEDYLRQSIVDPNAYVVEGYAPGVMYQNWGEDLTEQEINDLVAYLMSLQ